MGGGKEQTDKGILYGACADGKRGEHVLNGVHVEGEEGNKGTVDLRAGFIRQKCGASCREGSVCKGNVNRMPYTNLRCDHVNPHSSRVTFCHTTSRARLRTNRLTQVYPAVRPYIRFTSCEIALPTDVQTFGPDADGVGALVCAQALIY